ncbi:MAG: hypothetical protein A3D27_01905 [Omnitrophica WOR_2 bacterium RIFCSPHIGHO2_02_FULL_46_37]|nr:MAG: hypothetical protein A3D27_01905 [Omnitrophica WOR_2 bacterium RIFCSPHIGHO2_02_FULL_46_37]OGX43192.1 MAG: hypothetical protein A3H41_00185 [Omnitrophica WOR_2 bacterium RIFCSPLOWO2_02_FULL_45_28]
MGTSLFSPLLDCLIFHLVLFLMILRSHSLIELMLNKPKAISLTFSHPLNHNKSNHLFIELSLGLIYGESKAPSLVNGLHLNILIVILTNALKKLYFSKL